MLNSHVIAGKAVVPTALMLEMLAHAALHGQPGYGLAGVDELRVLKGIKGAAVVKAMAGQPSKRDGWLAVPTELRGADGSRHASAVVLLGPAAAAPAPGGPIPAAKAPPKNVYKDILFHGPDMRFIQSVTALSDTGIEIEAAAALPPKQWLARPWRDRWVADPAALDAAFQAMIVWTSEILGALSLPSFIGKYRQFLAWPARGTSVRCRARRLGEGTAGADIDFVDAQGRLVARLEGYECTVDAELKRAFALEGT